MNTQTVTKGGKNSTSDRVFFPFRPFFSFRRPRSTLHTFHFVVVGRRERPPTRPRVLVGDDVQDALVAAVRRDPVGALLPPLLPLLGFEAGEQAAREPWRRDPGTPPCPPGRGSPSGFNFFRVLKTKGRRRMSLFLSKKNQNLRSVFLFSDSPNRRGRGGPSCRKVSPAPSPSRYRASTRLPRAAWRAPCRCRRRRRRQATVTANGRGGGGGAAAAA